MPRRPAASLCCTLLLVSAIAAAISYPVGVPVVICPSLDALRDLVYRACASHAACRDLYDLSDLSAAVAADDAMDREDVEYEKAALARVLEWFNLAVPLYDITRRPNLIAPQLFVEQREAAVLAPSYGTLYYDSTGATPADAWRQAMVRVQRSDVPVTVLACDVLAADARLRDAVLAPTLNLLLMQRLVFDAIDSCSNYMHRRVWDASTGGYSCQCPTDKACGSPGLLSGALIWTFGGLGIALVVTTMAFLIAGAVRILNKALLEHPV